MKHFHLLIILLTFITADSLANSPPISIFGPCQKRCIIKYGEIKERVTNAGTLYRKVDVANKREFSLCRLGCSNPDYSALNLPEFLHGQSAYQNILTNIDTKPVHKKVVKEVSILCLDQTVRSNSTVTDSRAFAGNVLLVLNDGILEAESVYFIEVLSRGADDDENSVVFNDWCYTSNCNISFNATIGQEVRVRVSTFDDNGPVGGVALSRWYNISNIISKLEMSLKFVEWNDDKAAARFSFDQATNVHVPECSFRMMYKNELSSEYKRIGFHLDHTREILVRKLEFNQNYTMHLLPQSNHSNRSLKIPAPVKVQVPECSEMVNDITMCAPSPVSALTSYWNMSSTNDYNLIIEWNYFSALDGLPGNKISTSHFLFSVHPLITTNNEKCEKYEPIRRDVFFTHRKYVFNVPDSKCNYEVEVSVFDTKQRKSETKKIKVFQVSEPLYMSLLPADDITTTIGLVALLIAVIITFALIFLICFHKNRTKKAECAADERIVYTIVDDTSKTVIGVRPPFRFATVGNGNRDFEAGIAQQTHSLNQPNGNQRAMFQNKPLPYYDAVPAPVVLLQPYGADESDFQYDYVVNHRDHRVESELSDEVFEEDICLPSPNSSFNDSPSLSPMAPIAPYEEFDNLPAHPYQTLQIGKPDEQEGNPYWLRTTAVDTSRAHCYSLKYAKDYSEQTRKFMRKELELLRTFPVHQNCVRFDGVVIGRWENIPYQITGILMENCLGGSLHKYINIVGSVLRRQAMVTPNDNPHLVIEGSPSPSSGYNSFVSKGRKTPDAELIHRIKRVSVSLGQFAEQISSALQHLHNNRIVHTRVSTISVYLSCEYTDPLEVSFNQMVKLGDFGNAARSSNDVVIDQNLHQPPEVALGKKYEAKGDIWQFGTCLVEMCSLGVPYQSQKQIPTSGIEEFDKQSSTIVLQETAKKCLSSRNRPTALDLCSVFRAIDTTILEQSLTV